MLTWIILGVIVLLLLYAVAVYNRLVRLRQLTKEAFSGITVQLRRRADLVPNLVETVKGYASHERETLDQVTAHRGDAVNARGVAATAQADNAMTAMLGRLFAVAEAYPELRATENFQQLQSQLSETEDQIAITRRVYNDTVQTYNTGIQQFPAVLIANAFHFEPREFFDAPEEAEATPEVSFSEGKPGERTGTPKS